MMREPVPVPTSEPEGTSPPDRRTRAIRLLIAFLTRERDIAAQTRPPDPESDSSSQKR